MRAVYCKCKNTYSIECKTNQGKDCNAPEYWKQGIGRINALPTIPLTDATFNQAIADILVQDVNGNYFLTPYGKIQDWDVSQVTDMSEAFRYYNSFNGDISKWNVSNVINMGIMFYEANSFNQDISAWNTSNVTDMNFMFFRASNFNQNIGSWDVSNVTAMYQMFYSATSFNKDIGSWDVSNVTLMQFMFRDATSFNQDLSSWSVNPNVRICSQFDTQANSWILPKPNFTSCTI